MEEMILRSYETFDEVYNGFLEVKDNSNLMYIRIGRNAFIAREFIDCITSDGMYINYTISYHNVKNHENILTLEIKKSYNELEISNQSEEINIIPLSKILNIKGNNKTFISMNDVDEIINFKEEFILGKKNSII